MGDDICKNGVSCRICDRVGIRAGSGHDSALSLYSVNRMTGKNKKSQKTDVKTPKDAKATLAGGTTTALVSETKKWFAGIVAALIVALIVYIAEAKRPIMEVALNFGLSKYWSDTRFRTTPPATSEISGYSRRSEEDFHVRIRNAGEVPLFDCQPIASSRPMVNGAVQSSLNFEGGKVNLNPRETREWLNMKMRFYAEADQYQIVIICSCSYYDLFNIRRETKYVETGVIQYVRPTFKSLLSGIDQFVDDKQVAAALRAKVEQAQNAVADEQIKVLTDLLNQIQGMDDFYKHSIGDDVSTLLLDAERRQGANRNLQQSPKP